MEGEYKHFHKQDVSADNSTLGDELAEKERRKLELPIKIEDLKDRIRGLEKQPQMPAIDIIINKLKSELKELEAEEAKINPKN